MRYLVSDKDIDKRHANSQRCPADGNRLLDFGVMAQNDLMSNAEDVADQVREQKALPGNLTLHTTLLH